jgi:hypothetical protein
VIEEIPPGSLIQVRGMAKLRNMLEARWHNELYAIFEADLSERSEKVSASQAESDEPVSAGLEES